MNEAKKYELDWEGKKLIIETGQLANLAHGSCKVQYGDTVVLATACMSEEPRPEVTYFPLQVEYRENMYAAGKISGSRFIKREGRPSDEAILNGRIIDRSIRPLFDEVVRNDIQVVITVLSIDEHNTPVLPGLIGAVCALNLSDIPFKGGVAGAGVVIDKEGKMIVNPSFSEQEESKANLFISNNGEEVVMIETDAKEATEDEVYKGIELAVEKTKPVLELLEKIRKELGKEKRAIQEQKYEAEEQKARDEIKLKVEAYIKESFKKLHGIKSKEERRAMEKRLKEELRLQIPKHEEPYSFEIFGNMFEAECRRVVLDENKRIDGRDIDELRPISAAIDILPRTHGTAVFQRGETQVLSIVTLGSPGDEQIIDGMQIEGKKRYMHHYNFPGFSVGEPSPFRGTGRREIGHGALAEKALEPVIPSKEDFPYTIRVVSEVLSSNGSSSQASACGSSLSLMAAGVPIKRPVAGIAMGLITSVDKTKNVVLTDIQGVEDHAGDMDFKVAGTTEGVTAVQLDIKLGGITMGVVKEALVKAKAARLKILEVMKAAIAEPKKEMSPYAPRIEKIQIDPEKIRDVIGPGGKIINEIIDETGVAIDIEDDGMVYVTSNSAEGMAEAVAKIQAIVKEVEVGEIYEGEVIKIVTDRNTGSDIGAIVQLSPNHDGMVHVSQIAFERVEKIEKYIKTGDKVKVKVMKIDKEKGRIELSIKELLEKPADYVEPPRDSRGPRKPFFKKPFKKDF